MLSTKLPNKRQIRILIIDDDASYREELKRNLEEQGFVCELASDGREASVRLQEESFDIIALDWYMPNLDGADFLNAVKAISEQIYVIVISRDATVDELATEAGADDFLPKDFRLPKALANAIRRGLRGRQRKLSQIIQSESEIAFAELIGKSDSMIEVKQMIRQVAQTDTTVLITGESGVGKELVARAIHALSPRSEVRFVALNCTAIPETLIESELFGHTKGSFTGAVDARMGRFELANNGTLFLDEVGELSKPAQAKLLRVLQEREFERVGSNKTIKVNVRVIAATNKKLEQCVTEGEFREDLFYRLNVFRINVPPLREHLEDIDLLVPHILSRLFGAEARSFHVDKSFLDTLKGYHFPGNVRELVNIIERATILSHDGVLDANCLTFTPETHFPGTPSEIISKSLKEATADFERKYFTFLLKKHKGNVSQCAMEAGVNRQHLHKKLKELHIHPDEFRE